MGRPILDTFFSFYLLSILLLYIYIYSLASTIAGDVADSNGDRPFTLSCDHHSGARQKRSSVKGPGERAGTGSGQLYSCFAKPCPNKCFFFLGAQIIK